MCNHPDFIRRTAWMKHHMTVEQYQAMKDREEKEAREKAQERKAKDAQATAQDLDD